MSDRQGDPRFEGAEDDDPAERERWRPVWEDDEGEAAAAEGAGVPPWATPPVHARGGDFESAVRWQKKALEMPPCKGTNGSEDRLTSYQAGQADVTGQARPAAFSLRAASATSSQVFGGVSGSSPARRKWSLFQNITAVEELKGMLICRPSFVW